MQRSPKKDVLSKAQLAFAELLRNNPELSAKDAALEAGCTATSARVMGPRWKKLPAVQAIIAGGKGTSKATSIVPKATKEKAIQATPKASATYHNKGHAAPPLPAQEEDAEPLTDREQRFCLEYMLDHNSCRAYMRTYPNSSYDSARANASRLIAKDSISRRIAELEADRLARLSLSADQVMELLTLHATYDPRELFDADWRLKPFDELSPDAARMISGFTTKATTTGEDSDGIVVMTNVKLPDRMRAVELLGRYHKLFVDRIEIGADEEFARRLSVGVKAAREARRGKK